jgi:hypothetical protein
MTHISDRYDFRYWPPMALEQPPVIPAQSAQIEELSTEFLYIPDRARRQAVYATGDWVDIVDFWLEADEPKTYDTYSRIDGESRVQLVRSAYHLSASTFAFHRLLYEMSYRVADEMDIDPNDFQKQSQTPVYKLVHEATNQWNTRVSNQHLLVARSVLEGIFDGSEDLPLGLAKKSQLILAKVALRWGFTLSALEYASAET